MKVDYEGVLVDPGGAALDTKELEITKPCYAPARLLVSSDQKELVLRMLKELQFIE